MRESNKTGIKRGSLNFSVLDLKNLKNNSLETLKSVVHYFPKNSTTRKDIIREILRKENSLK